MSTSGHFQKRMQARPLLPAIGAMALVFAALALLLLGSPAALAADGIVYVDHTASGNNNGSSWDDAYNTLQAALDALASTAAAGCPPTATLS